MYRKKDKSKQIRNAPVKFFEVLKLSFKKVSSGVRASPEKKIRVPISRHSCVLFRYLISRCACGKP